MNAAAASLAEEPSMVEVSRSSLAELFAAHMAFVWRSLRQLGVREADLEDEAQEVFLIAYRRYEGWDGEHARAWLYAIARRCAAGYRRRVRHKRELTFDSLPESAPGASVEADPAPRIELDRLDRALANLDEDKRAVFVLFEIEEMSMREVALTVECPLQTAYARLYAARRELTRVLSEER